ncbi:hypothetical protein NQ317_006014 [Molorchus minor]|uniref:Uncharacterized protein n=1 Tax=Molorchus minor TaxID=1323400 RepID=A0ABQ9J2B8_9CUCU|nr:hypothetical protein NQ317_006014 [Molorchus minor]
MASKAQRIKYVFDNEMSTSEDDSYEDTDYVPSNTPKLPVARKTAHPWEETEQKSNCLNRMFPESNLEYNIFPSPDHGFDKLPCDLLNEFPLDIPDIPSDLLCSFPFEEEKSDDKSSIALEEHNYTVQREKMF